MTGRVETLENVISPDLKAVRITERWLQNDTLRQNWKTDVEEIRRYVYATDTTQTTNNQLPWKNKTTVPKLCQIRDNLLSNYTATLFPQRKSVAWEADEKSSNSVAKRDAIQNYMSWVMSQPSFKHEMDKVLMDYIDFGNGFVTVDWSDQRVQLDDGTTQAGYVGPVARRISPLDLTMNPTADSFIQSPKIIRSITSMGELREMLQRMSNDENRESYEILFEYLRDIRFKSRTFQGDWMQQDHMYSMEGFTSFRDYLKSDFVEILTFYGDWYDQINDNFEKNRVIMVVDRHKLISDRANPSYFGYPPIFHVPWRKRQDNLWGMGPLANLVGMQYRMDHVENMGADIWDLSSFPVQKVKGFVEDFTWQPGEKIFVSEEGDVELLIPPGVNLMMSDMKIERIQDLMEAMAGAPKEAMGFRSPGEKTKYEVQRLENASSRIYSNKIKQFEELIVEPVLNAMLELARRNMSGSTVIKVFDNDFNLANFMTLTVEDITGIGRIKPVAARHFAEQADLIQNLTSLTGSNLWPVVQPHFSGVKLAKIVSNFFNLDDYEVFTPYVALAEQADAQMQVHALQEQIHMAAGTATGQGQDFDLDQLPGGAPPQPQPQAPQQ